MAQPSTTSRLLRAFQLVCALLATSLIGATPPNLQAETLAEGRGARVVTQQELLDRGFVPYRRKVALIIGIDRYQDQSGIPELSYAVRDARAIEDLLRRHLDFDAVKVLEDENARRSDILRAVLALGDELGEEDQFFFYFAGHGITFGDGDGEMGYLVPQDASGLDESSIVIGGLSMSHLRDQLVRLPAKHVLLVVDSCYSGYAAVVARGSPTASASYLHAITSSKARQIITAGKRGQSAFEKSEWGHSALTYKLLQGLRERLADRDRNGIVPAAELFSFLSIGVSELTSGTQTPQFADLSADEGEFVFILSEDDATVAVELSQPSSLEVSGNRVEVYDRLRHLLWQHTASGEIAEGLLADLDSDGGNEVVVSVGGEGSDAGKVLAFDFRGEILWSRDTQRASIYDGAHSGRFGVVRLAVGELFERGRPVIVVVSADARGWPVSQVTLLDAGGTFLASYWHPGQLRDLELIRSSTDQPWRILIGGFNNDLGPSYSGEGPAYGLFLLDPLEVQGEAPPYHGEIGRGTQLWYGVLSPKGHRVDQLTARDVDGDGIREIMVMTAGGDEIHLSFDGRLKGAGEGSRTAFTRVE